MPTNVLIIDPWAEKYRELLAPGFAGVTFHTATSEDGVGGEIAQVDAIFALGHNFSDGLLERAAALRWAGVLTTGVDAVMKLKNLGPDVIITSGRGIHGPQMAEMAFMHMLVLTRDFTRMQANQRQGAWQRWPQPLLANKTVGIVGVGVIAENLALKCRAFEMTVLGVSATVRDIDGFDRVYPRDALAEVAGLSDYLILLLPYTPESDNICDAAVLAAMKPTAYLINLARGGVLDEDALVEALKAKRIAGAGIDIFRTQPLPPGHPLWRMENVIITPNLGGMSNVYEEQVAPILRTNLRHFVDGEASQMINIVKRPDHAKGR